MPNPSFQFSKIAGMVRHLCDSPESCIQVQIDLLIQPPQTKVCKVRKNLRHPSRNTVAEEASEVTLDPQLRATIDACAETFSDYYNDQRWDRATISVDHEGDWSIMVMKRANEI
jgi:hypothetical protein